MKFWEPIARRSSSVSYRSLTPVAYQKQEPTRNCATQEQTARRPSINYYPQADLSLRGVVKILLK